MGNWNSCKKLRERLGVSQQELALLFGCTVRAVENWEQEAYQPISKRVGDLIALVQCQPKANIPILLSRRIKEYSKFEDIIKLLNLIKHCNDFCNEKQLRLTILAMNRHRFKKEDWKKVGIRLL